MAVLNDLVTTLFHTCEHAVMMILSLVRNYLPSYQWVVKGGWNIADLLTAFALKHLRAQTRVFCREGIGLAREARSK
jgi:formate dehydrogenase